MCKTSLHDFLVALPKCEHHVHIEGTLSPTLLFSLAKKNAVTLPSMESDPAFASAEALLDRYAHFTSLEDFLHYYFLGFSVFRTADDFAELAYAYLTRAHAQGVRHAEVFFDPQEHKARGVSIRTVVSGLDAARRRAESEMPSLSVLFIPCLLRHLGTASAEEMLRDAVAEGYFADDTLAGLGMAGTEMGILPETFRGVFDAARAAGVRRFTAHAGEEGPGEYVAGAIALGCHRIDHGRSAAESGGLMREMADLGTLVTMCPISNVVLGGVARVRDMPVRAFLDAGVRFSINSDDPAYFGAYIQENYCAVQEAFDLDVAEWERIALASVDGSWCPAARKGELRALVWEIVRRQGAVPDGR